ncbi:hypothetical protein F0562_028014 [Nyssa sinensis]|uniref:Peptidase A1 domain-containing protein n=1 Tax=Nyssa sinensis TaxID=561372 RepID=A0A5J5B7I3_9ASTE|nr:hypothetical protein F0562_028014 [Nyssa sinensis]
MMMLLFLVILSTTFLGGSAANQPQSKSTATNRFGSSVVFPVTGNVYPRGYYHVTLNIGHPPKPYFLDIDTGSDLTWLQCDAPCTKCTPAPHTLYKPRKNLVTSVDTIKNCQIPSVLLTQMELLALAMANRALSHSYMTWVSYKMWKHHSSGPAELHYGRQAIGVKGLSIVFDSGSTYSYLNSQAYKATLSMVKKDLNRKQLKDANEDRSLPVCWKGTKPFKSIHDVKNYFKTIVLNFMNAKNIQLQLPPEAYLVVTDNGIVCLGILNGGEIGLGNFNIIGDISLQDKMVIYDNEKQQIGWFPANCDRLPSMDRDYKDGLSQPYTTNTGILEENSPTGSLWFD